MDSPSPNAEKFRHRHLQNNRSRWLCTQKTRCKLLELLVSQWCANDAGLTLKQHWLNVLCKCLLGPSKKRISPMNCLSHFSRRQRMEAEYYKDIIVTLLYLHRYRSLDTNTWWCTTLCFLGRWEDCIVFLQICRNMMQSSQQTRGIHPILFQCLANCVECLV